VITAPLHFYTLTGNLLAERSFDFATWSPGKTQRATAASFQVGGKGINVSKMLNRLGAANTALCFTGGSIGADCAEWLHAQAFNFHVFPTTAPTRSGLVVRSTGQSETTFLGPDAPPDAAALRACAVFIDALPDNAVLALCGSFPGWDSSDAQPLRDALERLIARATVCADTYGPLLTWLAARPVALVKINRDEFDLLYPTTEEPKKNILTRLAEAQNHSPVKRWIITDGPGPVCFISSDSVPASREPPLVKEISPTGSGDVLFACVLHGLLARGFTLADAISFALPYASANAASAGIADFSMNQVPQSRSFPA
jgi:1-phosphofructokinase